VLARAPASRRRASAASSPAAIFAKICPLLRHRIVIEHRTRRGLPPVDARTDEPTNRPLHGDQTWQLEGEFVATRVDR